MRYALIENGIVSNILESDEIFASKIGAIPCLNDTEIGFVYENSIFIKQTEVGKTPEELRQIAYSTEKIISWNDKFITVDNANSLFMNYFAEGNTEKYEALRILIIEAKDTIRIKYPDKV